MDLNLLTVASTGNAALLDKLLKAKLDPDIGDSNGRTPLVCFSYPCSIYRTRHSHIQQSENENMQRICFEAFILTYIGMQYIACGYLVFGRSLWIISFLFLTVFYMPLRLYYLLKFFKFPRLHRVLVFSLSFHVPNGSKRYIRLTQIKVKLKHELSSFWQL